MPRILVVDDEAMIREGLKAYLEDEGMQVDTHERCETALQSMEQGRCFDICILDLRLPQMDGHECIQSLHNRQCDLQFLIYTGSSTDALQSELGAMGIDDQYVFHKPLMDMSVFVRAIHQLLGGVS
ncbi:MAG: response regulator [Chromatiales bacterium]|nr:response regulator [Chromatiales bacterium]